MEHSFLTQSGVIIGSLAFVISVITELTKNIGVLKRIPTELQVLVLGLAGGLLAAPECCGDTMLMKYVCGGIHGLMAAFVATYGWEKLHELSARFLSEKKQEDEK